MKNIKSIKIILFTCSLLIISFFIWYGHITYIINKSANSIANGRDYCWVIPVKDGFSPEYEYRMSGGIFFPPIYRTLKTKYFTEYGKRPNHFGIHIPIQKGYVAAYSYRWKYGEQRFRGGVFPKNATYKDIPSYKEYGIGSYNFCIYEIENKQNQLQ